MKKIVVLFSILILCFSLCGCGGEEIEISMDNVEQYFEIKPNNVTFGRDEFGDLTGADIKHYVAIKEEYADQINLKKTDVSFKVKHNSYETEKHVIDFEKETFEWGEIISDTPSESGDESTYYFDADLFNYEEGKYFVAFSGGWESLPTDYTPEGYYCDIDADFEFTGATGTLVLK